MKKLLFICILFFSLAVYAQESDSALVKKYGLRTVFFSFGLFGFPDLTFSEFGVQVNPQWSISGSCSIFFMRRGIWHFTFPYGLTVIRYFNKDFLYFFNNAALEILTPYDFSQGMFQLTLGSRGVHNRIVTFFGAIGVSGAIPFIKQPPEIDFAPVIKWGMSINF